MTRHPGDRRTQRGLTLVEVLMVLALATLMTGMVTMGAGVTGSARLRRSAGLIMSAIRVAYARASSTGKVVRLVFDFGDGGMNPNGANGGLPVGAPGAPGAQGAAGMPGSAALTPSVALEDANADLQITKNDRTGGAAAATEAERKALEEAETIVKGPRTPRPQFMPAKAYGFDAGKGKAGKELERGVRYLQIETAHQEEIVRTGRAYLYFWPGGQTEHCAIQLYLDGSNLDVDMLSLRVSPLTGKTEILKGRASMPRPRTDADESERQDTGF